MPKAPRKIRVETVVEEAPSHDGSLTFAAYQRQFPDEPIRPLWTHCIYDTTSQAADPQHISYVARIIHENTYRTRQHDGSRDRIEVIGMPMPSDATDEQRATKCREHHVAEINSRNAAKRDDWCIPGTLQRDSYLRVVYVIFRFGDGVSESMTFLFVFLSGKSVSTN